MPLAENSGNLVGSGSTSASRPDVRKIEAIFERTLAEIGKVFVGQDELVEATLIALFSEGNVLIEGVPGLGKTLLVNTLSKVPPSVLLMLSFFASLQDFNHGVTETRRTKRSKM